MDNVIRIGSKPSELTGSGTEYLVIDGTIVAKFYDGNLLTVMPSVNGSETTASAA